MERQAAERLKAQSKYYEVARAFGRFASQMGGAAGSGRGRRDNVIATDGGPGIMEAANPTAVHSRQARLASGSTPHYRGTATEPLHHPGAQLSIPLLCHAQDASRHARQCTGDLSRRLWHAGRAVRASHPTPDAEGAAGSDRPLRRVLLAQGVNFETLAEEGIISPEDLQLFEFAESAEERWARWLAADCGPIPPWSMQKGRIDVCQCSDLRHLPMLAIPKAMLTLPQ